MRTALMLSPSSRIRSYTCSNIHGRARDIKASGVMKYPLRILYFLIKVQNSEANLSVAKQEQSIY